ncbi:MAG TPA: hypothetical protein VGK87_14145, partial [Anaerolineae bacterium]
MSAILLIVMRHIRIVKQITKSPLTREEEWLEYNALDRTREGAQRWLAGDAGLPEENIGSGQSSQP